MTCDNAERECEWEGNVGTLEEHVATCKLSPVPCPNQCGDDTVGVRLFLRKDLGRHLKEDCPYRDYECEHCGGKSTHADIMAHVDVCLKRIIPCPSAGCTERMAREAIQKHVQTECEHTVVACKYRSSGCKQEGKRGEMGAHELDDKLHLHMSLDAIVALQDRATGQEDSATRLQDTVARLQNTVAGLQNTMAGLQNTVAGLQAENTSLQGALDYTALQLHMAVHSNASVTFEMSNYQKRKAGNEVFRSSTFYSHLRGYHMLLQVDVGGSASGKGTHLSVYTVWVRGKHDAQLKWPFVGKLTFTLLNQLECNNHYSCAVHITASHNSQLGVNWGFPRFIRHSKLAQGPVVDNTQYLKDDKLYIRVSVEVADHKPWLDGN